MKRSLLLAILEDRRVSRQARSQLYKLKRLGPQDLLILAQKYGVLRWNRQFCTVIRRNTANFVNKKGQKGFGPKHIIAKYLTAVLEIIKPNLW